MTETTLAVPEISCDACKTAIEGALRPLRGVEEAEVDVAARSVRVSFGPPATLERVREAVEEQGYEVAGA